MEDKIPWVIGVIAIIVVAMALSMYLAGKSKETGSEVIDAWGDSAKSNLTFGSP